MGQKTDIISIMKSLRLSRPHAIMMVGIPGSGKTFFAEHFAATFGAPYINSSSFQELARDEQSAETLVAMALAEITKTNQTFIFEGYSDSRVRRTEFARLMASKGYKPMIIWVQTDESTARSRALKTQAMAADTFTAVLNKFSAPHQLEKPIVISGKHTYASQAKVVLSRLSAEARPTDDAAIAPAPRATPGRPDSRSITIR